MGRVRVVFWGIVFFPWEVRLLVCDFVWVFEFIFFVVLVLGSCLLWLWFAFWALVFGLKKKWVFFFGCFRVLFLGVWLWFGFLDFWCWFWFRLVFLYLGLFGLVGFFGCCFFDCLPQISMPAAKSVSGVEHRQRTKTIQSKKTLLTCNKERRFYENKGLLQEHPGLKTSLKK